jgi:hypothetical protein
MRSERALIRTFVTGNTLLGLGAPLGAFLGLPVRYLPVDLASGLLAALLLASAWGLARDRPWCTRVLRISALCELGLGLTGVAALALGVAYLGGIHGAVGRNALQIAIWGSLLIAPYLIVYPCLQLLWIERHANAGLGPSHG